MGHCVSAMRVADDDWTKSATIVFVLGGPGSGKGTQCAKISERFKFKHLSTGDLLRAEVASGSALGKQCDEIMKSGGLVPVEITLDILYNAMEKAAKDEKSSRFLIDGFPREMVQITKFQKKFKRDCDFVLYVDCSDEEMTKRIMKRGETSGRSDDNAEAIKKRLATFRSQTMPAVEHYQTKGKLRRVDSNQEVGKVWEETQQVVALELLMKATIVFVLGGPGSGKGTQCARISSEFAYKHLSTGDLLRAEVASGSALGKECKSIMDAGGLVPVDSTLSILRNAMRDSVVAENCSRFLVDGFPREMVQITAFQQKFGRDCDFVLYYECSDEEMTKRIMKRGETSGRSDDNAEAIKKRLATFRSQTMPAVQHYFARRKLREVGAQRGVDEVWADTAKLFRTFHNIPAPA